jgi:HAD superfamily hydrolase (TIGR01662 family)
MNLRSRRAPVPSSRIKAILLDAGNTLVFLDGRRLRAVFGAVGVQVSEERFAAAELRARAKLVESMHGGSNGMEPKAWKRYFKTIFRGAGVPWWKMRRVARETKAAHLATHLWTQVPDGTEAALRQLRDSGYRLAVISNADGTVEGLLETVGLLPHFEFVIDSGTVPWEKPDARIFEDALGRMGVEAHQSLYVGDLYHVDVLGAREAGMEAVLVDPWDRARFDVDRIAGVGQLPEYLASRGGRPEQSG